MVEKWQKRGDKVPVFCDVCGDIAIAWKPIKVEFPDESVIIINVCVECWNQHFEEKCRKLKVARLLKILKS